MERNSSWKPCMKSWHARSIPVGIFSTFISACIFAFPVVLAATDGETAPLFAVIVSFLLGAGFFLISSFVFVIERRKYQMNEDGITLLYCGRIRKFYPWTMFPKIVVCDIDHATKFPDNCHVVIRFASKEEPNGPHSKKQKLNISGIASWRKYFYTLHRFASILFLEYSPELLDEVVRLSGLPFTFSLTQYGKAKLEANSKAKSANERRIRRRR